MKSKIKFLLVIVTVFFVSSCSPNCEDNKQSYENGYRYGLIAGMAGNVSCSEWADEMEEMGRMIDANGCFCDGFNDGTKGNGNKFENK